MNQKPLVPHNCVLTDFAFMPLDVRRLLNSETWVLGNDSERSAAMCLWLESWHQKPAASVPNNPKMLAHLSKAGTKWAKVKDHVLRGWVDGGDGRLYHPVVAEKALEAWIEKLSNAISGNEGNAKRWGVAIDSDELKSDLADAIERLKSLAPQSKTLNKKIAKTIKTPSKPDRDAIDMPSPPDSPPDRNRQGQGQGQGQGNNKSLKALGDFSEKTTFGELGYDALPDAWGKSVMEDWPELHPDDLRAKWVKFRDHSLNHSFAITEPEWLGEFAKWLATDAPKFIEQRKNPPKAKPEPEKKILGVPVSRIAAEAQPGESEQDCAARLNRKDQAPKTPKPHTPQVTIEWSRLECSMLAKLQEHDPELTRDQVVSMAKTEGVQPVVVLQRLTTAAAAAAKEVV